jgi:predicted transcriptional regulator
MSEFVSLFNEEELVHYINIFMKKHKIRKNEIADILHINYTNAGRLLKDDFNDEGVKEERAIRYSEAYDIIKFLNNRLSPFQDDGIRTIYTESNKVEENGTIYSNETIESAASKMTAEGNNFTQLVVKDKETNKCLGILTDFAVLKAMLSPFEVSKDWLRTLKQKKIGCKEFADLIDKVPTYPSNAKFIEVAEGLMRHYSVLIQEDNGEIGIITRWDFLKLIKSTGSS